MTKKLKLSGFFLFIAVLFLTMLYINARYFKGSSGAHVGITYAKDFNITSEKSGIIKAIEVVPGQQVKKGDLLVNMENSALAIEIAKLKNHIELLKKEKQEKASLVQSKIDFLKAESGIKLEELESEIKQIKSEVELNTQLTQRISKSITEDEKPTHTSPHDIRISSLTQEKKLNHTATEIQINDLVKSHQTDLLVLENEINLLQQEHELLIRQQNQLMKFATFDGVVENVFVRAGEEVEAYTPMMTINPTSPSSVVGYMVGPRTMNLLVGSKVRIHSYNHKNINIEGEVIGFGSIAQLPEILQKSTAVKAFGTEIFISIPEQNSFVKGEKVIIK